MTPDLTKLGRRTVAPRAAAPAAAPPIPTGQPLTRPLPEGKLVVPIGLTPQEQAVLGLAGYEVGDPVPTDLADNPALQGLVEAVSGEMAQGIDSPPAAPTGFEKVTMPPVRPMTPRQKAEIAAVLEDAKTLKASGATGPMVPRKLMPGVDQAIRPSAQTPIVNDLPPRQAPPPVEAPAAEPAPAPEAPTPPAPPAKQEIHVCQNCNHRSDKPVIEVTPEDLERFCDFAITGQPYDETISLLKGRLKITLRELRLHELDMIANQVRKDVIAGRYLAQDSGDASMRYRTALQIKNWETPAGATPLPADALLWDLTGVELAEDQTPLSIISEWVYTELLTTESLIRMVTDARFRFDLRTLRLNALASNPNS